MFLIVATLPGGPFVLALSGLMAVVTLGMARSLLREQAAVETECPLD